MLHDADTSLPHFPWRDYDADTGRFTALDPLGKKGGDRDWYGYCLDEPVNRVDVWGLEGEETGSSKPYYCWGAKCDDNGTLQGDYKPIEMREGGRSFVLDFFDPIVTPFMWYYDYKNQKD